MVDSSQDACVPGNYTPNISDVSELGEMALSSSVYGSIGNRAGYDQISSTEYCPTPPVFSSAASNDLQGVVWALEREGCPVDLVGDWYSKTPNSNWNGDFLVRKKRTVLSIAAQHGSMEVVNYLLQRGADPNWRSEDDGFTALHCAAIGGSVKTAEILAMLLRAGASRDSPSNSGHRAADLLPRQEQTPAERLLGKTQAMEAGGGSLAGLVAPLRLQSSVLGAPQQPSELDKEANQTDDFRIYEFKVRLCSKTHTHDWTECPYTHPGEKARRRDPRKYPYSGNACPDFRKGSCRRGDSCEFAHGVFECWLHPSRYRTQLCKDGTSCARRVCFFAHRPHELRAPTGILTSMSPPSSPTIHESHRLLAGALLAGDSISPPNPPSISSSPGHRELSTGYPSNAVMAHEMARTSLDLRQRQMGHFSYGGSPPLDRTNPVPRPERRSTGSQDVNALSGLIKNTPGGVTVEAALEHLAAMSLQTGGGAGSLGGESMGGGRLARASVGTVLPMAASGNQEHNQQVSGCMGSFYPGSATHSLSAHNLLMDRSNSSQSLMRNHSQPNDPREATSQQVLSEQLLQQQQQQQQQQQLHNYQQQILLQHHIQQRHPHSMQQMPNEGMGGTAAYNTAPPHMGMSECPLPIPIKVPFTRMARRSDPSGSSMKALAMQYPGYGVPQDALMPSVEEDPLGGSSQNMESRAGGNRKSSFAHMQWIEKTVEDNTPKKDGTPRSTALRTLENATKAAFGQNMYTAYSAAPDTPGSWH